MDLAVQICRITDIYFNGSVQAQERIIPTSLEDYYLPTFDDYLFTNDCDGVDTPVNQV